MNDDDSDVAPLYKASLSGWQTVVAVIAIFWCLGSGMYTLALVVRSLTP